jgi:hypothetical protein
MVTSLRSVVGIAAIWIVAVAGVSATAWVAIDRAGRDLTSSSLTTLPPVPLLTPTLGGGQTGTAPNPQPSATTKPSGAQTSATATTITTTPAGTPRAVPTPAAVPRPVAVQPTAQDRSINVNGGLVSAACTGATITLRIAQPDNDWRVHVDTSGGAQIVVTFHTGDEDQQSGTQVSAVCTKGTPAFTVTNG